MDMSNPRRILAVGPTNCGLLDLIQSLTGSRPSLNNQLIAGTTHNWEIKTSYYTATIPIWLDEIESPSQWSEEFLKPEAQEVLQALGALIVCFKKPIDTTGLAQIKSLLENVGKVIKKGCGSMWDGVSLAVAMPQSSTPHLERSFDEWEDLCQESGFEYVDSSMKGQNEFCEPLGLERLKEALQSNNWENTHDLGNSLDLDQLEQINFDPSFGFLSDAAQVEMEPRTLKESLHDYQEAINAKAKPEYNDDNEEEKEKEEEEEVDKLEAMVLKMQAIRDMGAEMPHSERKKMAMKALNEFMENLL